ncbi:hypothetical protein ACIO93_26175 [Streptomyces sp. NPDC087903]|uniref:hypothetical protein n=1 Tax=Streptomyces sp. NPDC087903 TaxID=3365819 RepID=UPI0038245A9A
MYREFVVPGDQEILEAIGEWPEGDEDSDVRSLTLRGVGAERIVLSYDALARSVRVRWRNGGGDEILDIFREGATRMAVHSESGATYFSLEFQSGECVGSMTIRVFPSLTVTDRLLFA